MKSLRLIILFVAILLLNAEGYSQHIISRLVDRSSGDGLPFASIIEQGTVNGVYSDIDGRFSLSLTDTLNSIEVNLVGYEPLHYNHYREIPALISLQAKPNLLAEISIRPGINPAERIIQRAINNKSANDPEGSVAFTYKSYNKLIFGASIDSTLLRDTAALAADTSAKKAADFFNRQHLFMMESITERKFLPPNHSEESVLANRVSGLKNTDLFLLGTQLQSFSFYGESVELLGEKYLSPLANNAINKYYFELEDTTYINNDTVFAISFRPRTKKNFASMTGRLYINTNGYAIQQVVAEPKQEGKIQFKIEQQYAFIENKQWFPMQLNSHIVFDSTLSAGPFPLSGDGRSYIKNIQLGAPLKGSDFSPITLQILPEAEKANDTLWNQYREHALDEKEKQTYHVIDSLGKAINLDRRLKAFEALSTGQINLGYINFDLRRFMSFNNFEGFRLGGGIQTSHRVSEKYSTGAYLGYGFKDKELKYGGNLIVQLYRKRNAFLKLEYQNDVMEMGGNGIRIYEPANFMNQNIYKLFISRMDRRELLQASATGRLIGNLTATAFLNTQYVETYSDYLFRKLENETVSLTDSNFQIAEAGITLRYAPGEKLMRTNTREIRLGGHLPVFHFQFTKGLNGTLNGEYAFNRFDVRIDKTFNLLNFGKLSTIALAGMCKENVPLSLLYNAEGTYEKFTIVAPGSFQTMHTNEFMHSRYAAFHIRHMFRDLNLFGGKFKPNVVVAHSMLWGDFNSAASHNFTSKQAQKGFFESGIQLDKIFVSGLSGIGLGVYYRYGTYALPSIQENIAIKLTTSVTF